MYKQAVSSSSRVSQ